jgi:hypothetical protein
MALSFGEKMDIEVNEISGPDHLYYFNGNGAQGRKWKLLTGWHQFRGAI